MYPPRYTYPNYNMQYQVRPNGFTFDSNWATQHRNRPTSYHSKGLNNFQSQTGNEEHWCETCDRGFPTLHVLENHKQQHQKCNIDGCQFVAHPKVITKHIQMQHSTGLFKKIANLDKPEEIKKWREERKNLYPTRENIEKKIAEIKEKVDRGEKMGMKHCRENNSHKIGYATKRKFNESNHKQNFKRKFLSKKIFTESNKQNASPELIKKPSLPQRDQKLILPINDVRTLKPFTGILHLLQDNDDHKVTEEIPNDFTIDDDYVIEESNENCNPAISEPVVCEALSSLMCNYESSDNESTHNTEPQECNLIKHTNKNNNNQNLETTRNVSNQLEKSDDESGPEEIKILKLPDTQNHTNFSKSNSEDLKKNSDMQKKVEKTRRNNVMQRTNTLKFRPKLPSTLLEKLLSSEIRQERNIVLQCIRHIVKCNYFEKTIKM